MRQKYIIKTLLMSQNGEMVKNVKREDVPTINLADINLYHQFMRSATDVLELRGREHICE